MPDGLSDTEADEWDRAVGCFPDGFYTAADQAALAVHCRSWVLFNEAADVLRRDGQTLATKEGMKAHPAVATFMRAAETLLKVSDKLGMSPSARARMAVPIPKERKGKFDGLLGGKPLRVATTNERVASSRSSKS